ncbi:GIY-YIG nuclease family protein [Streptomyces sp. S.PB5]|uniref:GIY-YIG nuclease family protein n=1 Tax=Streptomyces sp. S.PB5 TaxID=3020844 RepID=UPI0025AED631|nr:GIY-YIG nuclease family protein [Streptomyces sp. S.PB5]MDN3029521.1 GIY-YIG nuclease family protein [Streptomyces sp. S.PB5]
MTDIDTQFLRSLFDEEGGLHTAGRTALYRLYGPEGLLYVGITICPLTRIRTHLRDQPWGSEVIAIRIEYPGDAEAAERRAVHTERPRHNVVFNGPAPSPPPDPASRLRVQLAVERRRLEELEATVPESSTHLRLLTRAITTKRARVARLAQEIRLAEDPAAPRRHGRNSLP